MLPTSALHTPSWLKTSEGPSPASLCSTPVRRGPTGFLQGVPLGPKADSDTAPFSGWWGAPDETAVLQLGAGAPGGPLLLPAGLLPEGGAAYTGVVMVSAVGHTAVPLQT